MTASYGSSRIQTPAWARAAHPFGFHRTSGGFSMNGLFDTPVQVRGWFGSRGSALIGAVGFVFVARTPFALLGRWRGIRTLMGITRQSGPRWTQDRRSSHWRSVERRTLSRQLQLLAASSDRWASRCCTGGEQQGTTPLIRHLRRRQPLHSIMLSVDWAGWASGYSVAARTSPTGLLSAYVWRADRIYDGVSPWVRV